jgi:ferredoxin
VLYVRTSVARCRAAKVRESVTEADLERCIGCGLCVARCDAEAVHPVPRQQPPDPPQTIVEMGLKIAAEKGKQEDFIKIMGR